MAGAVVELKAVGRFAALFLAATLLCACVNRRPPDAVCPAASGAAQPSFDASLADTMAARWNGPPDHTHQRTEILVLSGGGAWGAYGAGFLNGWSQRPSALGVPRPQFDVVTGISVGAIMAPYAFLGPQYDGSLMTWFRGADASSAFAPRSILSVPFWDSINDSEPLEDNLRRALSGDVISGIRAAAADKRTIWVGAVNFDTAAFTEFNLSALARDLPPESARDAMVDRIMGASAVPTFMPPRFINGCMYMDGDVRQNVFISHLHGAVQAAAGTDTPKADIYVIVNGTVGDHRVITGDTLLDIAVRGFEIAENEIQRNSLREVYDYARENGYRFYWTSADDVVADPKDIHGRRDICPGPQNAAQQFDPSFTRCLFDAALMKARDRKNPWRTDRP